MLSFWLFAFVFWKFYKEILPCGSFIVSFVEHFSFLFFFLLFSSVFKMIDIALCLWFYHSNHTKRKKNRIISSEIRFLHVICVVWCLSVCKLYFDAIEQEQSGTESIRHWDCHLLAFEIQPHDYFCRFAFRVTKFFLFVVSLCITFNHDSWRDAYRTPIPFLKLEF